MPSTIAATKDPEIEPRPPTHDNQDVNQIGQSEIVIETENLDGQRPAKPGEAAAKREGDGESAVDVDAEAARHAFVVNRGPHPGAEPGVFNAHHERQGYEQREPD